MVTPSGSGEFVKTIETGAGRLRVFFVPRAGGQAAWLCGDELFVEDTGDGALNDERARLAAERLVPVHHGGGRIALG